jgi:hypothetical protein
MGGVLTQLWRCGVSGSQPGDVTRLQDGFGWVDIENFGLHDATTTLLGQYGFYRHNVALDADEI